MNGLIDCKLLFTQEINQMTFTFGSDFIENGSTKDYKIKTSDNIYELLNESNRLILINHNSDSILFELN